MDFTANNVIYNYLVLVKHPLTVSKRAEILTLRKVGFSEREISSKVNRSKTAVH